MPGRTGMPMLLATLVAFSCPAAHGEVTVRDPGTFVVDRAGVLDPEVARQLEALLLELHNKTTAQVKVLTVKTIDGDDWFGWVQRHYDDWKLGRQNVGNGALIALAVSERRVRIHTGYGLEHVLPDSWCGTVSREAVEEHFRQQRYTEGLARMTVAVAGRVAAASDVKLTRQSALPRYGSARRNRAPGLACGGGILPLVVVLVVLASLSRNRRHCGRWGGGLWEGFLWGSILNSMMRGGRSHWGGGSFGGGFGGGFGGFGGGSFGGGGMSGGGGGGASW